MELGPTCHGIRRVGLSSIHHAHQPQEQRLLNRSSSSPTHKLPERLCCLSPRLRDRAVPSVPLSSLSVDPSLFCVLPGSLARSRCNRLPSQVPFCINFLGRRKPDSNRIELLLWLWCR